jgi:hypothetical protein
MTQALNPSRLVRVSVNLSPIAAPRRTFGTLMIAGDSDVIDVGQRVRTYVDLDSVAADFGTSAPEYLGAALYFGQTPRPFTLMIGRWARTATSGLLKCGILPVEDRGIADWNAITDGSFRIKIDDGSHTNITGLDFSEATNLNAVANIISGALSGATCTWTGERFVITSETTGTESKVSALTIATASVGIDISTIMRGTASTLTSIVHGIAAETAVECAQALADASGAWYGLTYCASVQPDTSALVAVAEYIEATSPSRILGCTTTDTDVLDAEVTDDLASAMKDGGYKRTCVQYSANEFAVCSLIGRAFSVNFNANSSTITLMYKTEPGVVAEYLTETQAQTLKSKRCNVFVNYQNDTAIIQYGVMSGSAYFDEIHGLDWFVDALQNAEYNLLYTSKTKIPQTDAGQNQIVNVAASVCAEAVNNGLVAPGTWNADGFGQLSRGDYLKSGYYIYAAPMATQAQSIREQRIAPPMQIALKLAGAVQELDIEVNVNR